MRVRCPHCHNPIEIVDDSPLEDITCPSCGSSFSLVGALETVTHHGHAGRTLGHFELLEQLGMGAFGSVWNARDSKLDRTAAIKIPRAGQVEGEDAEKLLRDARAAAQLRHPNIVGVHEIGRENGTLYLVSDFIDGLTLADWLTGQKPTPREAAQLIATVADALHHAHEAGVVHRDLKPSNIMLDRQDRPHLIDFGLAKREAGEVTMTLDGQLIGTPAYMSPEQAEGKGHHADRRSDVYSLGVILFELLTGERPFRGNARMLIHQILRDEPPSPGKLNAAVPSDLETICLKCLEKDPARRYPTAQALAGELQCFLNNEPIQARPVTRVERAWRWSRREPIAASLLAAALGTLLLGVIVSTFFAFRAQRHADAERKAKDNVTAALHQKARAENKLQSALDTEKKANEELTSALKQIKNLLDRTHRLTSMVIEQLYHERTWSDAQGKPLFDARFVDYRDGKVILHRVPADESIPLELTRLSDADQVFIRRGLQVLIERRMREELQIKLNRGQPQNRSECASRAVPKGLRAIVPGLTNFWCAQRVLVTMPLNKLAIRQHRDENHMIQKLSSEEWLARRERLDELGGRPVPWR